MKEERYAVTYNSQPT